MGGRRGRVVTPNLVDQALDWYNLIRAKQQCRQHRTLLGTAERQTFAVEPHLERKSMTLSRFVTSAAKHFPGARKRPVEPDASVLQGDSSGL